MISRDHNLLCGLNPEKKVHEVVAENGEASGKDIKLSVFAAMQLPWQSPEQFHMRITTEANWQ